MVTAKLLNYTFVPRSESGMQIAPPKGDDDVVDPCLRERKGESLSAASLHAIYNPISVLDSGEIFPPLEHNTPHFTADPSLPAADFTPLEPFYKTAPFILYDLHLAEFCTLAFPLISTLFR